MWAYYYADRFESLQRLLNKNVIAIEKQDIYYIKMQR